MAELLLRCNEAGDIYKTDYSGYYCVDCEEYKVVHSMPCCWCCLFADYCDTPVSPSEQKSLGGSKQAPSR